MIISVKGIETFYSDSSAGSAQGGVESESREVILLLHGWGCNSETYKGITELLSRKFRVIVPDLPGFGRTAEPPAPWSVEDYAEFVLEFVDKLSLNSPILFCHSMGARVGVKMFTLGYKCERAVVTGGAGIERGKKRVNFRSKVFKAGKYFLSKKPDLLEKWRKKFASPDYLAASPIMRGTFSKIVSEDLTDYLHLFSAETLLIWGSLDTETPLSYGETMAKLMPDAGLAVMSGCGHYAFLENPAQFANILRSFFNIT